MASNSNLAVPSCGDGSAAFSKRSTFVRNSRLSQLRKKNVSRVIKVLLGLAFLNAIAAILYSYDLQSHQLVADSPFTLSGEELLTDESVKTINELQRSIVAGGEKKKRCALLFFGLVKDFKVLSLPAIRKNIIAPNPECDVFLHTYNIREVPKNSRNDEFTRSDLNSTEAYLLTDKSKVAMDTLANFHIQRDEFLKHSRKLHYKGPAWGECCQSHDNMIKQWHSIKGVWDLMNSHEKVHGEYDQVGLFRSDVYHTNPVHIYDSNASLPDYSHHGGFNDRLFYGNRKNSEIWADRFRFSPIFEQNYVKRYNESLDVFENRRNGYHSESYLGHLLKHHNVNVVPKNICVWRIRGGMRLKVDDCVNLKEFRFDEEDPQDFQTLMKYVPPGYFIEKTDGGAIVAEHWSSIWDASNYKNRSHAMLPVPTDKNIIRKNDDETKPKTGIIVLGMHQSLTDNLAGLLVDSFGFEAGGPLIHGHFDLKPVARQNDAFMWDQGITWEHNVEEYDSDRAIQSISDRRMPNSCGAAGLQFMNNPANSPWLLTDPRLSITLNTWLPFLHSKPATIFTYRHPLEVATDLQEGNGYNREQSFLLWIKYNKAAIYNSKDLCRVVTSNKAILDNPVKEMLRVSHEIAKCGIPSPRATNNITADVVNNFLDSNMMTPAESYNTSKILRKYGDCKVFEYEGLKTSNSSLAKRKEMGIYLAAMKIYCDLESRIAFKQEYEWPEIWKNSTKVTSSRTQPASNVEIEAQLRYNYQSCEETEDTDEDEWSCVKTSMHQHNQTLARFIVFQRDLGSKLQDLVAHYTSVVPYDAMVIIDHEGIDNTTKANLQQYASRGAHIWRCEGVFDIKADMWSWVVNNYADKSDFLFPVDGDEYMTILRHDGGTPVLHWNYEDLKRELVYLQSAGMEGLPFKTLRSVPIPHDCPLGDQEEKLGAVHTQGHGLDNIGFSPSLICQLKYTASDFKHYCYNKCFYRGKEFKEVDKGNHGIEEFLRSCISEYDFSRDPSEASPIDPSNEKIKFNLSNLTLLHLQSNGFADFVLHRLRGAADHGFNRLGNESDDKEPCDPDATSGHYCQGWTEFLDAKFDFYEMKRMYLDQNCQQHDDSLSMLLPLTSTFGPSCSHQHISSRPELPTA